MPEHIRTTRLEHGCIRFNLTHDETVIGRINVDEAFVSKAAFDLHQENRRNTHWTEVTMGIARVFEISYEET